MSAQIILKEHDFETCVEVYDTEICEKAHSLADTDPIFVSQARSNPQRSTVVMPSVTKQSVEVTINTTPSGLQLISQTTSRVNNFNNSTKSEKEKRTTITSNISNLISSTHTINFTVKSTTSANEGNILFNINPVAVEVSKIKTSDKTSDFFNRIKSSTTRKPFETTTILKTSGKPFDFFNRITTSTTRKPFETTSVFKIFHKPFDFFNRKNIDTNTVPKLPWFFSSSKKPHLKNFNVFNIMNPINNHNDFFKFKPQLNQNLNTQFIPHNEQILFRPQLHHSNLNPFNSNNHPLLLIDDSLIDNTNIFEKNPIAINKEFNSNTFINEPILLFDDSLIDNNNINDDILIMPESITNDNEFYSNLLLGDSFISKNQFEMPESEGYLNFLLYRIKHIF